MKILICSDGSQQAEYAIRYGGSIAAACGAHTTLLGITERASEEDAQFDALRRGVAGLKEQGVTAELIIKAGDPIEEIVRRTEETAYDMVVIGAVPKGTRGPYLMSAKAYKIIKAVEPPVLVVIGDRQRVSKVLVCSGGERYIDRAVEVTGEIARCTGASVTLFHVLSEMPADMRDIVRMEEDINVLLHSEQALGKNLRREKEELERRGVDTSVRLRHGLVLSEVFKEIKRGDYDLVVTGSSPIGGNLRTYIMGNFTREIVNRANCPVLVVRSDEEPESFRRILREFFSNAFGPPKG